MVAQPRLSRRLATRRPGVAHGGAGLIIGVFASAVYGGYFGAAQGVILISLLAIFLDDDLQRLNGTKNVLAMLVNGVAAIVFIAFSHIAWGVAALIAAGAIIGGQVGARIGRKLPPQLLRAVIVVVGTVVVVKLLI